MTSIFNQLDEMLTIGFTTFEDLEQYRELKQSYELETQDYSFSARELMGQLERLLDDRASMDVGRRQEYLELVEQLEAYDQSKANYYLQLLH